MNSYERVLRTISGEIPDRVPTFEIMIDPKVIKAILGHDSYLDLCEELDIDIVVTPTPSKMYRETIVDPEKQIVRNEWGMMRQYNGEIVSHPMKGPIETLEDALLYQAPDPLDDYRFEALKETVKRFKGKRFIGFHLHDGFNYSYYLSSMEDMMCNLILEPELVHKTVEIAIEHNIRLAERAIALGADFIISGDDYGSSENLLVSQKHFETFFLPGLQKLTNATRSAGAYMFKHCCGNINLLMDDLVGYGIRAMHPLDENSGMDQIALKKRYPELTVMGGVDCNEPLSSYSAEEMRDYVKELLRTHAPGGRYICASSNSVHSSAKPENFVAMHETVHTFGRYTASGELDW